MELMEHSPKGMKRYGISQQSNMPDGFNESLALASYLKLRREQPEDDDDYTPQKFERSLHFTGSGRNSISGGNHNQFDLNSSPNRSERSSTGGGSPFRMNREELGGAEDDADESGLGFTETITEFTPTDARAMRLLARTALREKHIAESHLQELLNSIQALKDEQLQLMEENKKLTGFESRIKKCKLPVLLLGSYSTWLHKLKHKLLARWKQSYLAGTLGNLQSQKRAMVFKLARGSILKWRAGKMLSAFRQWVQTCTTRNGLEEFKTKSVMMLVSRHSKRFLFRILRSRTVRSRMAVRLGKVMDRASLRDAFSKFQRFGYAAEHQSTGVMKAVQYWQSLQSKSELTRLKVKNSFLLWKTKMQEQKIANYKMLAERHMVAKVLARIKPGTHPAFNKWRHVTFSVVPQQRHAARLFRKTINRMKFAKLAVAFEKWRTINEHFKALTNKVMDYMINYSTTLQRKGFQTWATFVRAEKSNESKRLVNSSLGMMKISLRGWLSGKLHRAFRQWKVNAGFSAMFSQLHAQLQNHKHEHSEAYKKLHEHAILNSTRHQELYDEQTGIIKNMQVRLLNKVLRQMVYVKMAGAFRQWHHVSMKHAHIEAVDSQYQSLVMRRCAAVLRHYETSKLSHRVQRSFAQWKDAMKKFKAIATISQRLEHQSLYTMWHTWHEAFSLNRQKRKILKRLTAGRQYHMLMAGMRTWGTFSRQVGVERDKMKRTINRWLNRIQRQAFSQWVGTIRASQLAELQNAHIIAATLLGQSTLRTWFMRWTAFVKSNQAAVRNTKKLVINRFMARMRTYFEKWTQNTVSDRNKKRLKLTVQRVVRVWTNKHLAAAIQKWKHLVSIYHIEEERRLGALLEETAADKERLEEERSTLKDHHVMLERTTEKLFAQAAKLFASSQGEKLLRSTFYTWKTNHLQLCGVKRTILGWMRKYDTAGIVKGFNKWARVTVFLKNEEESGRTLKNTTDSISSVANAQLSAYEKELAKLAGQSALARVRAVLRSTASRKLYSAWNRWLDIVDAYKNQSRALQWKYFHELSRYIAQQKAHRLQMNQVLRRIAHAALWRGMAKWKESIQRMKHLEGAASSLQVSVKRTINNWLVALMRSGWMKWKHAVYQHRMKSKVVLYFSKRSYRLLGRALRQWQRNIQIAAGRDDLLKRVIIRMQSGFKMRLYRKFNHWKQQISSKSVLENYSNSAARWVRAAAKRWKLLRTLRNWQARAKESYLRVHGPPLVAAVTRAQHAALSVTDAVLTTTSAKVVVDAAQRACEGLLPSHKIGIFCVKGDNYLWGTHASYLSAPYCYPGATSAARAAATATTPNGKQQQQQQQQQQQPNALFQQAYNTAASDIRAHNNTKSHNSPLHRMSTSELLSPHARGRGGGNEVDPWQGDSSDTGNDGAGTTVLIGEGVVGRCAASLKHAVYRAGPGLGRYANSTASSRARSASPQRTNFAATGGFLDEDGDLFPVLTAVVPLVYRGHVVGVLQITDPNVDGAGVFFDEIPAEHYSPSASSKQQQQQQRGGTGGGYYRGGSHHHKYGGAAGNPYSLEAMLDQLDDGDTPLTADNLHLSSTVGTAGAGAGGRGHHYVGAHAVMIKELFCVCLALQLSTATTAALTSLVAAVATTFGRHIVDGESLVALEPTAASHHAVNPVGGGRAPTAFARYAWSPVKPPSSPIGRARSPSSPSRHHLGAFSPTMTPAGAESRRYPDEYGGEGLAGGAGGSSSSIAHDAHTVLGLTVQLEQAQAAIAEREERLAVMEQQQREHALVLDELHQSKHAQSRAEHDAAGMTERLREELNAAHVVGKELQRKLRIAENKIRAFQMEHEQVASLNKKIRSVANTLY